MYLEIAETETSSCGYEGKKKVARTSCSQAMLCSLIAALEMEVAIICRHGDGKGVRSLFAIQRAIGAQPVVPFSCLINFV